MSDAPTNSQKIKITRVWGGNPIDHTNLKDCYFEPLNDLGDYGFYGKHNDHVPTIPDVITPETTDFKFIRDGVLWTVSSFHLDPVTEIANGHWSNPRGIEADDGEFHAQAGPGREEEETASSATA